MSSAKQAHDANEGDSANPPEMPTGQFHRWRTMGGKLLPVRVRRLSRMPPQRSQTLYPYLLTGKLTNESEGVKWYAFVTIAAGILLVVLWARWLNDRMGGGSRRDTGPAPLVQLTTDQPEATHSGMATPYQLGKTATRTPESIMISPEHTLTPTSTPRPAITATWETMIMTDTPTFSPTDTSTPTGLWVWVYLTAYWPDDGPDWCLTWDDATERCISPLTSGDDFRPLEGQALACDPDWLGYTLTIPELDLVLPCLDTGVSFECVGGPCTTGLVASNTTVPFGEYAAYLVP